ncbi:MAG: LPP20 family lipoprotein/putitive lipoprotein [Treponematales bacterium]
MFFKVINKGAGALLAALVCAAAGCGTTGAATTGGAAARNQAASDAAAAAAQALAAMDNGGRAPAAGASGANVASSAAGAASAASRPAAPPRTGARPAWVDSPEAVYGKAEYLAAVGDGKDRQTAEAKALAGLIAVFGQSVQSDFKILTTYSEAVKNGAVEYKENTSVSDAVNVSASMDTLAGAEIADTWTDTKANRTYAVAVLEKKRANTLYGEMIRANLALIDSLVNLPASERTTLEGFSRLTLAATLADVNRLYLNVLQVAGNTTGIKPESLKRGDDYRLMAREISKVIPIGVEVSGDDSNRIKGAFAKAITGAGFRSGGANSRYMLKARVVFSNVDNPSAAVKYARIELAADLTDTADNSVLLPYNLNRREGHANYSEAQQRTLRWAEGLINGTGTEPGVENFGDALKNYLAALLPKR